MKVRLVLAAAVLALTLAGSAGAAAAGTGVATRLTVSAGTSTVSGEPVEVKVTLEDAGGKPVQGALIRLVSTVTFLASERDEIVDEATTGASGRAALTFAPTVTGSATVTARYMGDADHAASEASLAFDVREPVGAYRPTPVGISATWAKRPLVLLPFAAVWIVYVLVLGLARKVRRAGPVSSDPKGSIA